MCYKERKTKHHIILRRRRNAQLKDVAASLSICAEQTSDCLTPLVMLV
jgi:hypothetical protein